MLDHLVYATRDLDQSIDHLESLLGVRAVVGGQHIGRGTRNALLALGPSSYLEIVGPDAAQPAPPSPRWFSVDTLTTPKFVTWAAKATELAALRTKAAVNGIEIGEVTSGQRTRMDGVELSWQLTSPSTGFTGIADGVVPFFIDWGASAHPAGSAAQGLTLVDLQAEHPSPDRVRRMLTLLDVTLTVRHGAAPALIATIDGPRGRVELR